MDVAAKFPTSSLAWAVLAEAALADGRTIEAYAYARTGYHRGSGPAPSQRLEGPRTRFRGSTSRTVASCAAWPSSGKAAALIDEKDEAERCVTFLRDSSPAAADAPELKPVVGSAPGGMIRR